MKKKLVYFFGKIKISLDFERRHNKLTKSSMVFFLITVDIQNSKWPPR